MRGGALLSGLVPVAALFLSAPASAELVDTALGSFASRHERTVAATSAQVWNELLHPENWWTHTWSGDPANLRLVARPGGCLCETVPSAGDWTAGEVEHARVVAVFPGRMLRLQGGLGPLQSEGVVGTLTITLSDADGGGTHLRWDYVVGGAARGELAAIAPAVDSVQGEFLASLAAMFEDSAAVTAPF